jgi:Rod binding domain-containing protein
MNSIDPTTVLATDGRPKGATAGAETDRQEVKRLAQQFEAMLLTQMMREMRRSMLDDDDSEHEGLGLGAMTDTGDIAFGDALGQKGGLGFTSQMLSAFERQVQLAAARSGVDTAPSEGSVTAATEPIELPAAEPALVPFGAVPSFAAPARPDTLPAPAGSTQSLVTGAESAPVSSAYGWRRDPLTGATKFHAGVDIAVAYGRDVKAAAEGVVSFAGNQNGYGHRPPRYRPRHETSWRR